LVERLPPISQLPSAPSESGKRRPASSATRCSAASTQPASTVIVLLAGSSARTLFMRERFTITCVPEASGVAPPHMLVLPPCGTMATRASASSATTRETSSVLAGFTTSADLPW
jgi:hypothetical protein